MNRVLLKLILNKTSYGYLFGKKSIAAYDTNPNLQTPVLEETNCTSNERIYLDQAVKQS